jgi:hypothetical protein
VKLPAVVILGNFLSANMLAIDEVVLKKYFDLLDDSQKAIRKEACWGLSNILSGSLAEIELTLRTPIVPKLIKMLDTESFDVRKEIMMCFIKACTHGASQQVFMMVTDFRLIEKMLDVSQEQDVTITLKSLEVLDLILQQGESVIQQNDGINPVVKYIQDIGGQRALEQLQIHPAQEVYDASYKVIEKYFQCDEVQPAAQQNGGMEFM